MATRSLKSQWLRRLLTNQNQSILFRNNQYSSARKQNVWLNEQSIRCTSTTSTSKGHAISVSNLNATVPVQQFGNNDNHNNKPKLDLSFEDSKTAFKAKSTLQLLRGYLVFQLCSINFLVDNQKRLLYLSRTVFGKRLFSFIMKSTFYGHFVAGEDHNDIRNNVENMMKYGVKSILDYSAEEDLESKKSSPQIQTESNGLTLNGSRKFYDPSENQSEKNTKIFMDCIDAVSDVTSSTGIAAVKLTSLIRPELLLKLSSLISQITQFNKTNKDKQINSDLFAWKQLLVKNDKEFSDSFNNIAELKDLTQKYEFTSKELGEIRNMLLRIDEIVEHANKKNVRIFVDAEQTYFQDAIRRLTIELMRCFNKNKCVILNTYQNYLKSAFNTLKEDIELATREDFCFGAKLVRGAYMEQERERAKQMNYEDPINDNYDETTKMYEKSLIYCMDQVREKPLGKICVMVASHNEQTVKFAVEKMEEYKIKPADRIVCFGQLLGMCDYISFYLGGVGYSVYKYVPYGPVEEVLPYLSRRATENRGIFDKVKKEKRLILNELKRRAKSVVATA